MRQCKPLAIGLTLAMSGFLNPALALADAAPKEDFYTSADSSQSAEQLAKADQIRLQTMASIEELLKSSRGDQARNFELYMRLAELYAERHDYLRDVEMNNYERAHSDWLQAGSKAQEPQFNQKESKSFLKKSANTYRDLVRKFPRHHRTDEALFTLAKTLVLLSNDNAELYFKQLLSNHPNSSLVTDTHVTAGDFYFDTHQVPKAIEHYKSAMKNKDHPWYAYAVYKLAWSYYNAPAKKSAESATNLQKSLLAFKLVIHLADKDKLSAGRIDLRQEAINDVVMVYSDLGDTSESWKYFKKIGENTAYYNLLQKLAFSMAEQGKTDQTIVVLEKLHSEAALRPSTAQTYKLLAAMHDQKNDQTAVRSVMQRMIDTVATTDSPWVRHHGDNKELVQSSRQLCKDTVHNFAVRFHKVGLEAKQKDYLVSAADLYDLYLNSFSDAENAYDVRYYLADLQFDQKQFVKSYENFKIVSKLKGPEAKYSKDAALNAIVAANQLNSDQLANKDDFPPLGTVSEPISFNPGGLMLVSALDNYAMIQPKDKKTAGFLFEASNAHFIRGHYDVAIGRMKKIINDYSKSSFAKNSVETILSFYITRQDYMAALDWYLEFKTSEPSKTKKLLAAAIPLYQEALFLEAQQQEKQSKHQSAAQYFERYQTEFPKNKNADRALFNAVQNYLKAALPQQALLAGKKLIKHYRKSKLRDDIIADIALTEESLGNFTEATKTYQLLVSDYRRDYRTPMALMNSALIENKLGNKSNAVKLYEKFRRFYPKSALMPECLFELATINQELGNFKEALHAYEQYLKLKKPSKSILVEARALNLRSRHNLSSNGRTGLIKYRNKLLKTPVDQNYEARAIIAKLMFDGISKSHQAFKARRIESSQDVFKQARRKQSKLKNLVKQYQSVVEIGSPEYVVASLYQIGDLHESFYLQVYNAKAPKHMNEKQEFQYRSDLEAAAFPLRDQAYSYFEAAFKRSSEVETFTSWTQQTYSKMSELAAGKHPLLRAKWFSPSYISMKMYYQPDFKKVSFLNAGE
jgi:cellulose synthase operon protein C